MKINFKTAFLGQRNPRPHQSSTQVLGVLPEYWRVDGDGTRRLVRPLGPTKCTQPSGPGVQLELQEAAVRRSQEEAGMDRGDRACPPFPHSE